MCRELQNNSPGEQKRNCFGVDRGFDCKQWSKSSEPPFLTSKFLLSESVVNVIIKNYLCVTLLFPRHTHPSLLPVKEAVSVLSQPSNIKCDTYFFTRCDDTVQVNNTNYDNIFWSVLEYGLIEYVVANPARGQLNRENGWVSRVAAGFLSRYDSRFMA